MADETREFADAEVIPDYTLTRDGPDGKRWGHSGDVIASIRGFADFVAMVNPARGAEFQERVAEIARRYDWKAPEPARRPAAPKPEPAAPAAPETPVDPSKKWWKLW